VAQRVGRGIALVFHDLGTRMGWSASRPGRTLHPGKTRYPLYRRLVGPQGRSRHVRKISPPPGFDPRTVQPLAQPLCRLSYPAHKKKGKDERKSMRNCAKDRNIGTKGKEFPPFLQPFQNNTVIVHQVLPPSTVESKSLIRHYIT
jgi:hypothetical protein